METSDEDRRVHPQVYQIVEAAWQSREFKTFARDLEVWNIDDWRLDNGGRLPGGSSPRKRIALEKPRIVDSKAPVGLWRNCYNPRWLKRLKGPQKQGLHIIDEDFDFTLPDYTPAAAFDGDYQFSDSQEEEGRGGGTRSEYESLESEDEQL